MTKFIGWMLAAVLVAMALPAGAQTVRYIHTDALGTPVAKTDANRNVIERNEYEPFGAQLAGPNDDGPGYTGHVQDAATGMTYMQQRYYDPTIGRFLSVDPVTANSSTGANFNRYWYANNNPYKFKDPDGRMACTGGNMDCIRQVEDLRRQGIPTWQAGASSTKAKPQDKISSDNKATTLATVTVTAPRPVSIPSIPWGTAGRGLGWVGSRISGPLMLMWPSPLGVSSCEMQGPGACGRMYSTSGKGQRGISTSGEPNTWADHPTGKQSRLYGPDGRPAADVDRGHDHGQGNPHAHNWVDGVRQPGVPVSDVPEEGD